jgi:hypothetical protein
MGKITRPELSEAELIQWLTERRRKISVKKAAELNDICEDTFRARYGHLIKQISARRQAVELGDALDGGDQSDSAA